MVDSGRGKYDGGGARMMRIYSKTGVWRVGRKPKVWKGIECHGGGKGEM